MKRVHIVNEETELSFDCDTAEMQDGFIVMTNAKETGLEKIQESLFISCSLVKFITINTITEKKKKAA